jgi:hypothetical protein
MIEKALYGAISGLLAAVLVDLDAWKGSGRFDWQVAVPRWIAGAIAGSAASLGFNPAVQVGA